MFRAIWLSVGLTLLSAYGLTAQESPSFEVASIKVSQTPAPQGRGRGLGPREDVNTDPGRLTMSGVTLNTAIRWAYKLGVYEISGPDWISTARFDISGKAPASV